MRVLGRDSSEFDYHWLVPKDGKQSLEPPELLRVMNALLADLRAV